MNGPNSRGNASRSHDKSVRVATHAPLVTELLRCFTSPVSVLEHGMGISSTPLFHSMPEVLQIVSLEDDPRWSTCQVCVSKQSNKQHTVKRYESDEDVRQILSLHSIDFVLVDGPSSQRLDVLRIALQSHVSVIVEHDSETHSHTELSERQHLARCFGYEAHISTTRNPETSFYVRDSRFISGVSDSLVVL